MGSLSDRESSAHLGNPTGTRSVRNSSPTMARRWPATTEIFSAEKEVRQGNKGQPQLAKYLRLVWRMCGTDPEISFRALSPLQYSQYRKKLNQRRAATFDHHRAEPQHQQRRDRAIGVVSG